ncbi:MAG: DUF4132 domain-containing protein [Sedimentitalea sp.]
MLAGFIKNIFSGGGKNRNNAGTPSNPAEGLPFGFLDTASPGLSKRVMTYIMTGSGEKALDDVKKLCANTPNFENNHSQLDKPALWRTGALCFAFDHDVNALLRYVEVRAITAASLASSLRFRYNPLVDNMPPKVAFMLSLFSQRSVATKQRPDASHFQPTTMATLVGAVERLNGSETDIATFCLPGRHSKAFVNLFPHQTVLDFWSGFSIDAVTDALDRCDAKQRAIVLGLYKQNPLFETKPMLPYLFQQLQGSSKAVRMAVRELLSHHEPSQVEEMAQTLLGSKKAAVRNEAVLVLGGLGTHAALAALTAHKENESNNEVLSSLDLFLKAAETQVIPDDTGYLDAHGDFIALKDLEELETNDSQPFGQEFLQSLAKVDVEVEAEEQATYERRMAHWRENPRKVKDLRKPEPPKTSRIAKTWLDFLNWDPQVGQIEARKFTPLSRQQHQDVIAAIVGDALEQLPIGRVVKLACFDAGSLLGLLHYHSTQPLRMYVQNALRDGRVSARQLIEVTQSFGIKMGYRSETDAGIPAGQEFVRVLLGLGRSYNRASPAFLKGIWEVAAPYVDDIVDALPPRNHDIQVNQNALKILEDFPTVPQIAVQPLLFAAMSPRAKLRDPAQAMLRDVPGINAQLIAMLADKKQDVRANTARFLADRNAQEAVPALIKRLKTEKSELARADMISALSRLGGDTGPYLGRDALIGEAKAFVDKLPNAKITWLSLDAAPELIWADGTPADRVLLDGWLRLAIKLNAPLGSPLFGLYFDQMTPHSARAVADWILQAWLSYDLENLDGHSAAKGILALTHRATPETAGPAIAAFLKKNGRYVSQAKALVETAYAMGSKEAVQVLVATATRFRQRTVCDLADVLVKDLAEARGWSEDELADRSVPTAGFEDDGTLILEVGEQAKLYTARLNDDLGIVLANADGKEVKALPSGTDPTTKEAKAALSAAKKTLKAAATQQQARLYDAMLSTRIWASETWRDDLTEHPIMRRLIKRMIWRGLDGDGAQIASFRPTDEGEFLNADGDDVDLTAFAKIDIAHTANLEEDQREAWLRHLKDFDVKALFPQVSRPVRKLSPDMARARRLDDREGWMLSTFQLRAAAKKAGYERGATGDGGGFTSYRKEFRGSGFWADLNFTGSHVVEEDMPTAINDMQFIAIQDGGYGQVTALGKVPPLLLSEVWNDLHEIASKAAFDPDWSKKSGY